MTFVLAASDKRERYARIAAVGYDYASIPKMAVTCCNLCSAKDLKVISHYDRYGFSAPACMCNTCGLVFLNPVMPPAGYTEFYAHVYRPLLTAYYNQPYTAETIQPEAEIYAQALIERLRPFAGLFAGQQALDIGGSTGAVAAALLREWDTETTILDPSPDELREAEARGAHGMQGRIEDLPQTDQSFALITLCRTVDHLTDIASALQMIRSCIADGGLFFVDIVDLYRACAQKDNDLTEAVKIDHPYYLTTATMRTYLARAGWRIVAEDLYGSLHTGFFCTPGEPDPEAMPPAVSVQIMEDFLQTIHSSSAQYA